MLTPNVKQASENSAINFKLQQFHLPKHKIDELCKFSLMSSTKKTKQKTYNTTCTYHRNLATPRVTA